MTLLLKVLGLVAVTIVFASILKPTRPEIALLVTVAGAVAALFTVVNYAQSYFSVLSGIFYDSSSFPQYFSVALKGVGIGYITDFASDMAKDSGQSALSSKIVFAGKTAILILALPLVKDLLDIAVKLLE